MESQTSSRLVEWHFQGRTLSSNSQLWWVWL